MTKTLLILGATSAIARGTAEAFAKRGYSLFLVSRDTEELERLSHDLNTRFQVKVNFEPFDADNYLEAEECVNNIIHQADNLEGVLIAIGDLGEHEQSIQNITKMNNIFIRNFTAPCALLTAFAKYFEAKKSGFIIVITSVAGDRGRQSNYVYGAAKGGLNIFLEGLRNRLFHHNVHVMTVKPGFVDTSMSFGLPNLFLVAKPNEIGEGIAKAWGKKKNVVYLPWFWKYLMIIISSIPESIFKRLKL
jgi:decaprenylphospho-beta-D-erythro-pentofuranosid-2-ulose 2-reductase